MQRNVLEYLENTVTKVPKKIAYANENSEISFEEVFCRAKAIGTFLSCQGHDKEPVVVFMKKHPNMIVAFFGVIYAGDYYVPMDESMPDQRLELIFQVLKPKAVICDRDTGKRMEGLSYQGKVYYFDEIIKTLVREELIRKIRDNQIDTDPVYIVFTSGSTGIPKGVVACHRSVIDYIESLSEVLKCNADTVFGNQTPLYVDACLKELYSTLKFGATTYLIPRNLFLFPLKLVEFLNEKKINTVCWVVSALTMISSFGALEKEIPRYLHTIAFGSEVFPIRQFWLWKKYLPDARYINLYGTTEATGMSCYYEVDRDFSLEEVIPIGKPLGNTQILLLDDHNKIPKQGDIGEICIRGTSLTLGYYRNFEKTREVFVQNPLNEAYPELIYCTGDLGKYNGRGELIFVSRKDSQIKHMGHRIELGEIEIVAGTMENMKSVCCIFDNIGKKIMLYYVGDVTPAQAVSYLKDRLPRYMIPNEVAALETMPLTSNGKIDRILLREKYQCAKYMRRNGE
jgi:D-alanine--poly(phosphoribitol) ligase subunit 1